MYKINIHAHTYFSDGSNSPYTMAVEAKRLGFCALVVTDHYYPTAPKEWCSADAEKQRLIRRACREAKEILPVIVGIELNFGGEEMLVFGSAMIQAIVRHCDQGGKLSVELLKKWKAEFDCAFILCHPTKSRNWEALRPLLDGYEQYNSGQDMFGDGRDPASLTGLPRWCNSDAHCKEALSIANNLVDTRIKTETDLIRYIKRGKQPIQYIARDPKK